jgi:hypothetical protein
MTYFFYPLKSRPIHLDIRQDLFLAIEIEIALVTVE